MTDEFHELARQVRILSALTHRCVGQSFEQRLQAHGADISGLQYGLMRSLFFQQHTLSELSKKFVLHPSTLVPVIDSLEAKGLLRRERDPDDRRRTPLVLTEAGTGLIQRIPPTGEDDALVQSLRKLGLEKSRKLAQLLQELMAEMPEGSEIVRLAILSRLMERSNPDETTETKTEAGSYI